MESDVIEKQEKNKINKKNVLISFLIFFIFILVGGVFSNFTHSKYSLPLGSFFMYFGMLYFFASFLISGLKSKKTFKSFRGIICIIFLISFCILPAYKVFGAAYDLIIGPQKIVLKKSEIILKKHHQRYSTSYLKYLKGKTEEGTVKEIFIRGKERQEAVKNAINKDKEVTVYYFKGINELYDIKSK